MTGTFDEAGLGLAFFEKLPLGLNLVQVQVNGVQVSQASTQHRYMHADLIEYHKLRGVFTTESYSIWKNMFGLRRTFAIISKLRSHLD